MPIKARIEVHYANRQSIHSDHAKQLDTEGLRREFLIEEVLALIN